MSNVSDMMTADARISVSLRLHSQYQLWLAVAAVANAIHNANSKRTRDLPVTIDKLL